MATYSSRAFPADCPQRNLGLKKFQAQKRASDGVLSGAFCVDGGGVLGVSEKEASCPY